MAGDSEYVTVRRDDLRDVLNRLERLEPIALTARYDRMRAALVEAGEVSPSPTTTDDKRRACGAHDDCSGTGPDCFDPNICSACDGEGCEEGCGRRLGCRDAYSGPDSHKVCPRCGGTGRVTSDSAKPVAPLPNWPEATS